VALTVRESLPQLLPQFIQRLPGAGQDELSDTQVQFRSGQLYFWGEKYNSLPITRHFR
jgi:hypothetical protein